MAYALGRAVARLRVLGGGNILIILIARIQVRVYDRKIETGVLL